MIVVNCIKYGRKDKFLLKFQYEPTLIEKIKEISKDDREYDPDNKLWILKTYALYELMNKFKNQQEYIYFNLNNKDKEYFKKRVKKKKEEFKKKQEELRKLEEKKEYWLKYKEELKETYKLYENKLHENLKDGVKLYPYQSQAVLFSDAVRNVLLALDMGSGKTLVSISLSEYNNFDKVFVITPNSLKFNYYDEVEKFTNSKAHIIKWKHNKYTLEESKYIIVNYDFFRNKNSVKKFNKLGIDKIDCLILDECHKITNTKSNTYNNIKDIFTKEIFTNNNECKIYMSGTPMTNRVYQLYAILNQLSPLEFSNKNDFYEKYCGMIYDPNEYSNYRFEYDKANFELLFEKISPYVFRLKKEDILSELPSKTYQKIVFDMGNKDWDEYNNVKEEIIKELRENQKVNPLTILLRLRQYLAIKKVNNKDFIDFINTILENGEKVVIMDIFVESLKVLKEKFKDVSVLHYGDVDIEDRREMIRQFQDPNSNVKMFLSTTQTGKEGLTLTQASKLIVVTQPYSYGENEQVVDRVHRISQKNKVNAYYPIYNNTIDVKIFNDVEGKKYEIKKVLDGEEYESNVMDLRIDDLINSLK